MDHPDPEAEALSRSRHTMSLALLPRNAWNAGMARIKPAYWSEMTKVCPTQTTGFQPAEKLAPASFRFAVPQHEAKDLPVAFFIHTDGEHHGARTRPSSRTFSTIASTMTKGYRSSFKQGTSGPEQSRWIQPFAQIRQSGLEKLPVFPYQQNWAFVQSITSVGDAYL
jgi:hypothetical protein